MKLLYLLLILALIGCNNQAKIPDKITVETTPVKVNVSGEVLINIIQVIKTDPIFQQTVAEACKNEPTCATDTTNSIVNSLLSSFMSQPDTK